MYLLKNGRIITPERILNGYDLLIENQVIRGIRKSGTASGVDTQEIDAAGRYIMPGMIDIHADYIEHMVAPRPTSIMDFRLALREAERELITHGITTMFHSLSLYDFTEFLTSPVRSPENTRKLIGLIDRTHETEHIIHHRFHARFEIDNLSRIDELKEYIRENRVHLISFMDHTPGQGQYRNLEIYRKTLKGYRNCSDEEVDRIIAYSRARPKMTIAAITEIAILARENGLAVASHDDDSLEKVELVCGFGSTISEFPITIDVAKRARRHGMHTVAGAPNILLRGSHSGNLSAAEAILENAVDILCSDYYPAAMLHAVFHMHHEYSLGLTEMVRLVTTNPARAVLIGDLTGSIESGKRADLLIVQVLEDGSPAVARAFTDGVAVYSTNYRNGRNA
jgi:phosphonate metabolism protein PhnM